MERGLMILGVYGYQDSGKTTLVEKLVKDLAGRGYRVSSVKHTSSSGLVDREGKDSKRHSDAGSDPVILVGKEGATAWIRGSNQMEFAVELVKAQFNPDVIIVEGFKGGPYPKVALGDIVPRKGTVLVNPSLAQLSSYVVREVKVERVLASLPRLDCGKCGSDCTGMANAVADGKRKIGDCKELASLDVSIKVGGKGLPTGIFVSEIVDSTVRGMVSSLKGYEPGEEIEIRLRATGRKSKGRTKQR
jgi:molybdopterin-guanine dinucleotide biosynthesis protein B